MSLSDVIHSLQLAEWPKEQLLRPSCSTPRPHSPKASGAGGSPSHAGPKPRVCWTAHGPALTSLESAHIAWSAIMSWVWRPEVTGLPGLGQSGP